ncbi:MAG: hypothetical protein ACLP9L_26025 [Thermoguttaceae bacterium]
MRCDRYRILFGGDDGPIDDMPGLRHASQHEGCEVPKVRPATE